MKATKVIKSLGPIDLRNIMRDSTLSWMVFLPILLAMLLRWGLPALTIRLLVEYDLDLTVYYPVFLSFFIVILCPVLFGVLIGFLLLDEKDDQTLTALQVTPLSLNGYIAYRVAVPMALSFVLMFVIFPLANLGDLNVSALALTALASAPMAPMFALYLASFATNKVQGFALMKLSGFVLMLPIISYFVTSGWQYAFALVPTYWPMKVYWIMQAGEGGVVPFFIGAILYQSLIVVLLARRLNKVMSR